MANFNYIAYLGQANAPVQASSCQPSLPMEKSSDLYLRVLSPHNKKEYKTVSVRGLCKDHVDTPAKLKAAISNQCDGLNPEKMDIGYFLGTKKLWINNRLDISNVWNMIDKREGHSLVSRH